MQLKKLKSIIRKAIKEDSTRLYDHVDGQFYILEDGIIIPRKKFSLSKNVKAISVHTHMTKGEKAYSYTFSWGDIQDYQKSVLKYQYEQIVLLIGRGRIDIIEIEKLESNRRKLINFLKLTKRQIKDQLSQDFGKSEKQNYRLALRKFARKYGLLFNEKVPISE